MRKLFSAACLSWVLVGGMAAVSPPLLPAAIAQEVEMKVLTVTGEGREAVATSIAQVSLGVEVEAETAAAAQQEAARRSSAVVELLRDRDVEELQTTGIRLNPQYRNFEGERTLTSYIATNTVSFAVPIEAAGTLLDEAVGAGATRIQGVSFRASDEALAAAREVALRRAVEDAEGQANTVLTALNLSPEAIVGIQINGARPPMPVPQPRFAQSADAVAASTPVVGGEQTVTASVTLQIRY